LDRVPPGRHSLAQRVDSGGEAADGWRGVLAGKHLDDGFGGLEEFHGSAARVGAIAVLFGAVQVAVLAEISHA
jgi:hypothetical protein